MLPESSLDELIDNEKKRLFVRWNSDEPCFSGSSNEDGSWSTYS